MVANKGNLVDQVINIVLASTRPMPAHFTTNGNNKQSFCVDFDINPEDEYKMASFAWIKGAGDNKIIKLAEDVVVGSYILKKLHGEKGITELTNRLIKADTKLLGIALKELSSPEVKNYIKACQEYGLKTAQ